MSPIPSHGLYPEPSGLGMSDFVEGAASPHPAPAMDPDSKMGAPDMSWAKGLRVAIVHDWLNGMRGGEKVLELLCGLFPEATVFTLFLERQKLSPQLQAMDLRESWLGKLPGARRRYRHLLPLMPYAARRLPTSDFDLVLSSSHCVAHGVRVKPEAVHVCYCHTPMRYLYDQFDAYFPPGSWSLKRLAMGLLRGPLRDWDQRSASRVTSYLCNGIYVAQRIQRYYGREAIPVGAPVDLEPFRAARDRLIRDSQSSSDSQQQARGYTLCLGALEPYKRVDLIIEAFRRLGPEFPLVIAGSGSLDRQLRRKAPGHVQFRGWVPQSEVPDLVAGANAMVFAALEDFGIGPLEAAAAGVPSVAYADGGSLETVVEGVTGLHFIRQHCDDIASAVLRLAEYRWNPAAMDSHAARYAASTVQARIARLIRHAYEQRKTGQQPVPIRQT